MMLNLLPVKRKILSLILFFLTSTFSYGQFPLERAFPDLSFSAPVDLQHAGDGTDRIFVVEQNGVIRVFPNDQSISSAELFLDIRGRVASGGEMGLLGLAFHPDFESNGFFYVNYTVNNPRMTRISRFSVSSNINEADENSELILLTFNQPFSNHNGGQIAFGPDGYLYIATGDGGSAGDPENNAQSLETFLGKILRIDVDNPDDEMNYGIPGDNPFVGQTDAFEEIFAYGLRNPWRFSFDSNGTIWCGDVGQGQWEEVNIIESGGNYGWKIMEGMHCYNSSSCDDTGLILPIHEYAHNSSGGISITGGYVYEGPNVPELEGKYIFGDYGSQRIWSLEYDVNSPGEPVVEQITTAPTNILSFGTSENNELYVLGANGNIYQFEPTTVDVEEISNIPNEFSLSQNYPNPFNPSTTIKYTVKNPISRGVPEGRGVSEGLNMFTLKVYDILGSEVTTLVNEAKVPGIYEVKFNASSLASGIYYYRLQAGNYTSIKKMILMK